MISLKMLAHEMNLEKSGLLKYVKKKMPYLQLARAQTIDSNNQFTWVFTPEQAEEVKQHRLKSNHLDRRGLDHAH